MQKKIFFLFVFMSPYILSDVESPPKVDQFIKGYMGQGIAAGENYVRNDSDKPAYIYVFDSSDNPKENNIRFFPAPLESGHFLRFFSTERPMRYIYVCDQASKNPQTDLDHCNLTTLGGPELPGGIKVGLNTRLLGSCFKIKNNRLYPAYGDCGLYYETSTTQEGAKTYSLIKNPYRSACSAFPNKNFNQMNLDEKIIAARDCGYWSCFQVNEDDRGDFASTCNFWKNMAIRKDVEKIKTGITFNYDLNINESKYPKFTINNKINPWIPYYFYVLNPSNQWIAKWDNNPFKYNEMRGYNVPAGQSIDKIIASPSPLDKCFNKDNVFDWNNCPKTMG